MGWRKSLCVPSSHRPSSAPTSAVPRHFINLQAASSAALSQDALRRLPDEAAHGHEEGRALDPFSSTSALALAQLGPDLVSLAQPACRLPAHFSGDSPRPATQLSFLPPPRPSHRPSILKPQPCRPSPTPFPSCHSLLVACPWLHGACGRKCKRLPPEFLTGPAAPFQPLGPHPGALSAGLAPRPSQPPPVGVLERTSLHPGLGHSCVSEHVTCSHLQRATREQPCTQVQCMPVHKDQIPACVLSSLGLMKY